MSNLKSELSQLKTNELAAYWNILTMHGRMLVCGDGAQERGHLPIVQELLAERQVFAVSGKLLKASK